MSNLHVATRYAKAFYEAAYDSSTNKVQQDLNQFANAFPYLQEVICSPVISFETKKEILSNVFSEVDQLSLNFFYVLIDAGREGNLPEIVKEFNRLVRIDTNTIEVQIKTPQPLDDDTKNRIVEIFKPLTQKDLEFQEFIDKSLLGGFVLLAEDREYDASLKRKLKEFKQSVFYAR